MNGADQLNMENRHSAMMRSQERIIKLLEAILALIDSKPLTTDG